MIQLLIYQSFLHLRMASTYVMLGFIALSVWLLGRAPVGLGSGLFAVQITSMLSIWITVTFFVQLSAFHQVFFRSEALQYRLARLRNRSMVIGAGLIHITLLAFVASLPYAVLYFGLVDDHRLALLSWGNVLLFHVYLGMAAALLLRWLGSNGITTLILLLVLFMLPLSVDGLLGMMHSVANHPVVSAIVDLLRSHLDVFGNPDMLLLRGIQDTDALLRTLILTPILATTTYVLFLRGDHH